MDQSNIKDMVVTKDKEIKEVEGKPVNDEELNREFIDSDFYRFMIADFHGIARCKIVTKSAFPYIRKYGTGMTSVTVLLSFDDYLNRDVKRLDGMRCTDVKCIPTTDMNITRTLPWAGKGYSISGVFCETFWAVDGLRQQACPRYIARRLCNQLEKDYTLKILHASEMEFTMLGDGGEPLFDQGSTYLPHQFALIEEEMLNLSKMCEKADIPIETLQIEYAPGQVEVVLKPMMGIEGADNEFLFKNAVKEILQNPGQPERVTFMTNPIKGKVSNSNHYNHSLWWARENVEDAMWDDASENGLSKTAQYWLAGVLKHTSAMTATPHNITWGVEDRSTMIRVIARGKGKATYFENRVPGSAMNPYLALAAHVAAGMDGLRNKLELPPPGKELNFCGTLPTCLEDALQALETDGAMKEFLGEEFINWFVDTKRKEIEVVQQRTCEAK